MKKLLLSLLIGALCILLVAILLPAILGGISKGPNPPSPASKGRSLVLCIISKNIDFDALLQDCIWPESPRFTEDSEHIKKFSEAYFAKLFELNSDLKFSMFSGGGISTATSIDDFLAGGKNMWSYIGGDTPDSPMPGNHPPFLFTKNLRLTNEDLQYYSKPENANDPSFFSKFDASVKPYGDSRVVFVYRDGSTSFMHAKDLTPSLFFRGCEMPPNAHVVHPR